MSHHDPKLNVIKTFVPIFLTCAIWKIGTLQFHYKIVYKSPWSNYECTIALHVLYMRVRIIPKAHLNKGINQELSTALSENLYRDVQMTLISEFPVL